jgi:MSHA pilin protein MshC
MNSAYLKHFTAKKATGFTLIELVVVIIIIAIMAVTVVPKFFSTEGFAEFTYRDEIITKLRAIQLRTMQQTSNNICHTIGVTATSIGLLATDLSTNACTTTYDGETTSVVLDNDVVLTLSENITSFNFSQLGRPEGCSVVSPCTITLTVQGENELTIAINEEGYINAN